MAKGYIVVDMPENCRHIRGDEHGCPFGGMICTIDPLNIKDVMQHVKDGTKPNWCPIRPQPERREESKYWDSYWDGVADGRNNLINEMFEGKV